MSGNPGGRPRRKATWSALLSRIGNEKDDAGETRKTRIARALLEMAEARDLDAIELLFDRMDGKPSQAIIGDDQAAPITIRMIEVVKDYGIGSDNESGETA